MQNRISYQASRDGHVLIPEMPVKSGLMSKATELTCILWVSDILSMIKHADLENSKFYKTENKGSEERLGSL